MAMAATPSAPVPAQVAEGPATYRVAGFWRRLCAAAIDAALILPVLCLIAAVIALVLGQPLPRLREIGPDLLVSALLDGDSLSEALLPLSFVLCLIYFFLFHFFRGQTPGKRLLGMAVIDVYGERPGLARTLLRTCGYLLSALLFSLGFLWIGFDREKRALHDWLAGTYVVLAR